MTRISSVTLATPDAALAGAFYTALGLDRLVQVGTSESRETGFRGYTLSLVVAGPGIVDAWVKAARDAGAVEVKPVKKSFWGYGGVLQAPDGALWKIATSSKKDAGPTSLVFDDLVLLLGVADVKATKEFYVGKGLEVEKSYGSKYVQFAGTPGAITLGLYKRGALAKDAGVPDEPAAHAIVLNADAGAFTDPDGFEWA